MYLCGGLRRQEERGRDEVAGHPQSYATVVGPPVWWLWPVGFGVVGWISVSTLSVCLRFSAPIDKANLMGETPLIYAAAKGLDQMVQVLLDAKANPVARDKVGSFRCSQWFPFRKGELKHQ